MYEHETNNNEHERDPDDPERKDLVRPRIYVASLADYNDARLYGRWIDARQGSEAMQAEVDEMLRNSPLQGAEEWAIHEYEGFGPWRPDADESLETIARIAAGIEKYGEAFAEWVATVGVTDDIETSFEDAYTGTWESGAAFVEESLEDIGVIKEIREAAPGNLANYVQIDFAGYFDEMVAGGDVMACKKPGGGWYIFWNM